MTHLTKEKEKKILQLWNAAKLKIARETLVLHCLTFSILTVKLYGYVNKDFYLLSVHLIPQMVRALPKQKKCSVP